MVKRTHKRKQRGGDWYNPASWFSSSTDPYAPVPPKKSWSDWWSSTTGSAEASLASASNSISSGAQNIMSSANDYLSQDVNVSNPNTNPINYNPAPAPIPINTNPVGGKRRKTKSKSHRGGKSLGITYYATPVTGMKTAQPNYWIKGGKKSKKGKRKGSKKTRRHRK